MSSYDRLIFSQATKFVERLIIAGGSHIYTEKALKGQGKLALRVRNGSAEWLFQYYADGKRRMIKLGPASGDAALSLADAFNRVTPLRHRSHRRPSYL